jgi:hypothetical protein
MNIFEFWNESSEFPLLLMGNFALIYECFGLRARFRNELCSQAKVPLYSGFVSVRLHVTSRHSDARGVSGGISRTVDGAVRWTLLFDTLHEATEATP